MTRRRYLGRNRSLSGEFGFSGGSGAGRGIACRDADIQYVVAPYLAYLGVAGGLTGVLLWPAVAVQTFAICIFDFLAALGVMRFFRKKPVLARAINGLFLPKLSIRLRSLTVLRPPKNQLLRLCH